LTNVRQESSISGNSYRSRACGGCLSLNILYCSFSINDFYHLTIADNGGMKGRGSMNRSKGSLIARIAWIAAFSAFLAVGCGKAKKEDAESVVPIDAQTSANERGDETLTNEREPETPASEPLGQVIVLADLIKASVFGCADEEKILVSPNQFEGEGVIKIKPQELNLALNQSRHRIVYSRFQERDEENATPNDVSNNIDYLAGHIYRLDDKTAKLDVNGSYFLTRADIVANGLIDFEGSSNVKASSAEVKMLEKLNGRKVIKTVVIANAGSHGKVIQAQYERQGNNMLYIIAYVNGDKMIVQENPAEYDELSTWRVDDGGEMVIEEVLFIANTDKGIVMGLANNGPEGGNLYLVKEQNGKFVSVDGISGNRYWGAL
jgi:hypothetical protein